MRHERIGDYLVNQGLITSEQLQQVLEAQKASSIICVAASYFIMANLQSYNV